MSNILEKFIKNKDSQKFLDIQKGGIIGKKIKNKVMIIISKILT